MQYVTDALFVVVGALLILIGVSTWRQDRDLKREGLMVRGTLVADSEVEYVDRAGVAHRLSEPGAGRKGQSVWVRYDPDDPSRASTLRGLSSWFHWVFLVVGVGLVVLTAVLVVGGAQGGLAGT